MAAEFDSAPDRAAEHPAAARPTGPEHPTGPEDTGSAEHPGGAERSANPWHPADPGPPAVDAQPPAAARTGFAGWRDRRPFWGGVLVALAGAEILFTEKAPMRMVIRIGLLGLAGYIIPILMVLCGLLLIFHPVQRLFYSLVAVLATLGSWITSNIGGFFIGLLLGLVGSTLAFGWMPDQPLSKRKARRAAARRATPA
ncbi:DUF6114 domain-containing protein [Kitasatospora sp. NPDC059646]|uniref:DUF6114 domain-containing protein n=1 Tax=Kitasatospora sp. NPDC059646 TaxID=3346893 RepID=UPI0036B5EF5E